MMGLEADEPCAANHRNVMATRAGLLPQPPPSLARECQHPRARCWYATLHKEVCDRPGAFALLEAHAAELATKPFVEVSGVRPCRLHGGRPKRGLHLHLQRHAWHAKTPRA